jgi:uncharacterized membrane protein
MRNIIIPSLTLLILVVVTACGGQPTQSPPVSAAVPTKANILPVTAPTSTNSAPAVESSVATVSFAKDVMPILENSCTSCHGEEQMKAGLDLRTYDGLMAGSSKGQVLAPGNSADSFLVQQVTKGKMPKRGPKLTSAQIQIISDWINAGALNN